MEIFKKSLNTFLFFLTSFILYGTIINANYGICKTQKSSLICKPVSILSYPPKVVYNGIYDLYSTIKKGASIKQLFKDGDLLGMVAKDNFLLRERFKSIDSGFNFAYKKGERPNSGFILLSRADHLKNGKPSIELWDLNMQRIVYSWDLSKAIEYTKNNSEKMRYFLNPLVLEDGSLIFNTQGGNNVLIKIDRFGEIKKINQELSFHHSVNLGPNGNIYATFGKAKREGYAILDQNLEILELFYLDDIYSKHNLLPRLYSSNSGDPTHINDVEPVINKQNNNDKPELVLISLRSTSSIVLYNQKSKKIVSIFDGFVSQQHDVDVVNLDPLEISIFDNNVLNENRSLGNKVLFLKNLSRESNKDNTVNIYMPNSKEFRLSNIEKVVEDFSNLKKEDRQKTKSSGLSEYNKIYNSIIVEESNYGRVFEYDIDTGEIVWSFLNMGVEKKNFWRMSWSRLYLENPIKSD